MSKLYQKSEKFLYWILVGLLVFIPLYPKFPLANVVGTFVAIRIEDLVIGFLLFVWSITNLKKFKTYFSSLIFQAFVIFWLIGLLSVISGLFITYFIEPHLGLLHWVRRIEYMVLFLVVITTIKTIRQIQIMIGISIVVLFLVVIYGLGQLFLQFPVISTTNSEFSKGLVLYLTEGARVNSTFAGHYDLAIYLSMFVTLLASLFFYYRKLLVKFSLMFLGSLSFALLALTAARISFVATILTVAGVFWFSKKRLLVLGIVFLALGLVVIVPDLRHRLVATFTVNVLGGGGPKYDPPPNTITIFTPKQLVPDAQRVDIERKLQQESTTEAGTQKIQVDIVPGEPVNSTELGVYRSFGIRLNIEWPRALNAFYKNPILGTGYSSLGLATDNDILRSLGETGLLGTVSLLLIFYIIVKKLRSGFKSSDRYVKYLSLGLIFMILAMFLSGLFIDVLESSKVAEIFWILLGLGWAAVDLVKNNNDSQNI